MHAAVGDRLVVRSRRVGMPDRHAMILEVEGEGGEPPYRVRWEDNSHEGIYFPGSDATVLPEA